VDGASLLLDMAMLWVTTQKYLCNLLVSEPQSDAWTAKHWNHVFNARWKCLAARKIKLNSSTFISAGDFASPTHLVLGQVPTPLFTLSLSTALLVINVRTPSKFDFDWLFRSHLQPDLKVTDLGVSRNGNGNVDQLY